MKIRDDRIGCSPQLAETLHGIRGRFCRRDVTAPSFQQGRHCLRAGWIILDQQDLGSLQSAILKIDKLNFTYVISDVRTICPLQFQEECRSVAHLRQDPDVMAKHRCESTDDRKTEPEAGL